MSSNSDRSVPSNARPGNARPGLARPHVSLSDASRLRSPIANRLPLQAPERTPQPEKVQPRRAPPPSTAPPLPPPPREPIPEPLPVASAVAAPPILRPRRGRMWVIALAAAIPVVGLLIVAEILAPGVLPWNAHASAGPGEGGGEEAVATAQRAPVSATAPEPSGAEAGEGPDAADPEPGSGGSAVALGGSQADAGDVEAASDPRPDRGDEGQAEDAQGAQRVEPDDTRAVRSETRSRSRADSRRDETRRAGRRASRNPRGAERAEPEEDERGERASAEPGFLTIDARPYATVRIAGQEIGDTPIVRHALAPGDHVLEVAFSTGEVKRMRVTIDSGGVVRRRVTP